MCGRRLNRQKAFTLIELLTVVGIVTLLIAILAPSLSRARKQAKAAVCANNLRQIATGWQLYAQQYGDVIVAGRFPSVNDPANPKADLYYVGNGWKYRARWFAILGAQVGLYAYRAPSPHKADDNTQPVDGEVFIDPAVPERNNTRNYTYGYNFQFLGNGRTRVGGGPTDWIRWPVKIDRIEPASATVMAADNLGTAATFPTGERLPYNPTGTKRSTEAERIREVGNHAWALDPPRLTPEGDFCDDKHRFGSPDEATRSAVEPRHLGRANVVFCDGHVERMLPEQLGYVVNDDGSVPLTGAGTNKYFSGTGRDDDPPEIR